MLINNNINHNIVNFNANWHTIEPFTKNIHIDDSSNNQYLIDAKDCLAAYNAGGMLLNIDFSDNFLGKISSEKYVSTKNVAVDKEFTDSLNFKIKKYVDDTMEIYYPDGQLYFESFKNGSQKQYYPDGQLKYEELSDGTKKSYYEDGLLLITTYKDGSQTGYYKNGVLGLEKSTDGHEKYYSEEGNLISETLPDGSEKLYNDDGSLWQELFPEGISKVYSNDGLTINFFNYNHKIVYDNQGKIISKK